MSQAALRVVAKEDNEKKRALEAALTQIDRAFGKGSVMKMGARDLGVATDVYVGAGPLRRALRSVVEPTGHYWPPYGIE